MEFRLEKDNSGNVWAEFTIGEFSTREQIPIEALKERTELLKYCQRRLYALEDKAKRARPKVYRDIDRDLNKSFELVETGIVEKATKQPVK